MVRFRAIEVGCYLVCVIFNGVIVIIVLDGEVVVCVVQFVFEVLCGRVIFFIGLILYV
jgi:hypothetical protein